MWFLQFVPMFSVPIHLKPYIYHYSFARTKEYILYTVYFLSERGTRNGYKLNCTFLIFKITCDFMLFKVLSRINTTELSFQTDYSGVWMSFIE